jgi:hypothetical protein
MCSVLYEVLNVTEVRFKKGGRSEKEDPQFPHFVGLFENPCFIGSLFQKDYGHQDVHILANLISFYGWF